MPRLRTSAGEIEMLSVPWGRKNSGFTLLFEAYTMALVQEEMPMNAVARQVKETAPRLWRMLNHWVEKKKGELDLSHVRYIGVDETSRRKGYKYITQFVDLENRSTIFVCEGKSAEAFSLFVNWLHSHGEVSESKRQLLDTLLITFSRLEEAYSLREGLVEALNWPNKAEGLQQVLHWLELGKKSTLAPFRRVANFFQTHLFGIRTYFEKAAITNGLLEALNAKVQLAKRRARGFANVESFINMIYYINGGEKFTYPLKTL